LITATVEPAIYHSCAKVIYSIWHNRCRYIYTTVLYIHSISDPYTHTPIHKQQHRNFPNVLFVSLTPTHPHTQTPRHCVSRTHAYTPLTPTHLSRVLYAHTPSRPHTHTPYYHTPHFSHASYTPIRHASYTPYAIRHIITLFTSTSTVVPGQSFFLIPDLVHSIYSICSYSVYTVYAVYIVSDFSYTWYTVYTVCTIYSWYMQYIQYILVL
jgi:hypothetical protein